MSEKPNAFQKFLHRFAMLKPVSLFLGSSLHYLDSATFKLTNGKHGFAELVGLPMVEVTTIGAKSRQPRSMPLAAYQDGEKFVLIGSNFGRKPNPGWYYNLKANPKCTILINGQTCEYIARETGGEEREKYWQLAVSYYAGYEKYRERTPHRQIPVMLLERAK
jgi:deazaflavin-dependent oxidoreductase (nitroreductase family)